LAAGLCPDPLGELKRSPRTPSRNKGGLLLRGGEGKGGGRGGRRERGGERGGKGRGGNGRRGSRPPPDVMSGYAYGHLRCLLLLLLYINHATKKANWQCNTTSPWV